MKIKIKQFAVDMEVKNNGIELEVRNPDGSTQIGDCYVTKTGLTWCKGRTSKAKGIQIAWSELAEILASETAKSESLTAARGT